MAQIVCIDTGTVRPGSEIGDVVAIHDDDVELSGSGYANLEIIRVAGMTAPQVRSIFGDLLPEIQEAYLSKVADEWTFDKPEEKFVWKNTDEKWSDLVVDPKYKVTTVSLTETNKTTLADDKAIFTEKELILNQCEEKISLDPTNSTEIPDLNKAEVIP